MRIAEAIKLLAAPFPMQSGVLRGMGRVAFWIAALLWAYCLTAHVLITAGWSAPVLHPLLVGGIGAAIVWTTYLSYQSWPATVWPPPTPPSAVPRDLHEQARVKVAPPPPPPSAIGLGVLSFVVMMWPMVVGARIPPWDLVRESGFSAGFSGMVLMLALCYRRRLQRGARRLGVYRREDVVEVPRDSWRVREGAENLCDRPFGNDPAVGEFWSGPAIVLNLPLFAEVYGYGFDHGIRWSGEQLQAVAAELDALDAYWANASLPSETLAHLRERAGFVRQAVAVASECGGWLVII
jgi:hypothetical protein